MKQEVNGEKNEQKSKHVKRRNHECPGIAEQFEAYGLDSVISEIESAEQVEQQSNVESTAQ